MDNQGHKSAPTQDVSIIIALYNDWEPLNECLRSLATQTNAPGLEVIVVDDGSDEHAPHFIREWEQTFALTILRQAHQGISSARNRGVQASRNPIILFVDADCRFAKNCLSALISAMARAPEQHCFQLHLTGDCSTLVGRVEHLRLTTLQNHMLQPNGLIRYLNTAGFAIRRTRVNVQQGVFDPVALRAEDTLLLANLMQAGELPFFVTDAIVQHAVPLSVAGCLKKDLRSAYLEVHTYALIASKGVRVRATHRERLRMLKSMWEISAQDSVGRTAWFVLSARQALRWIVSAAARFLPRRKGSPTEQVD